MFTFTQIKYLHIPLLAKIFGEENISSLTNQTGEEINMERKQSSDHILPLFKGESAKQILDTINHSRIKPYTDEEKENAELRIRELLKEQSSK